MTALQKWAEPRPVLLTVDDYLSLASGGAFEGQGKTELIEGVIVAMNAQHRAHARVKTELAFRLMTALKAGKSQLSVLVEASVAMLPSNAPEPDILLTTESQGEGLVPAESVRLVIEVADSTLPFDEGRKAAIYAGNAVPEYWVVDLPGRAVHQHWLPAGVAYTEHVSSGLGETVTSRTIDSLAVETDQL